MKRIISISLLLLSLFTIPFVHGSLVNDKSPFTDVKDTGGADNVNLVGTDEGQEDSLVNVIRNAVNRILGILALIALIVLLYGGLLMVTSFGNEDKYKKGFTILQHAGVGIILIGVAWFIVSGIFRLASIITTEGQGGAGTAE